ncbi:hypothetical protein [Streptomyces sp. NPDC001889]
MTPADTLRAAASRLRALATAVPDGPWHSDPEFDSCTYEQGVYTSTAPRERVAEVYGKGDQPKSIARYVAAMHPGLGAALAEWLEDAADGDDRGEISPYALEVARQILGEGPAR